MKLIRYREPVIDNRFIQQISDHIIQKENDSLAQLSKFYEKNAVLKHNKNQFVGALQDIQRSYIIDILKDYKKDYKRSPLPIINREISSLSNKIMNRKILLRSKKEVGKTNDQTVATAKLLATEAVILANLAIQQTHLEQAPDSKLAYRRLGEAKELLEYAKKLEEQSHKFENTRSTLDYLLKISKPMKLPNHLHLTAPKSATREESISQEPTSARRLEKVTRHLTPNPIKASSLTPVGVSSNEDASNEGFLSGGMKPTTFEIAKKTQHLRTLTEFKHDEKVDEKAYLKGSMYINIYHTAKDLDLLKNNGLSEADCEEIIKELKKQKYKEDTVRIALKQNRLLIEKYLKFLTNSESWKQWPEPQLKLKRCKDNPRSISHYYHAYFSWHIYTEHENSQKKQQRPYPTGLKKWTVFGDSSTKSFSSTHYYGSVYYMELRNAAIIAHKGTSVLTDFVANGYYALLNQMHSYFFVAIEFAKQKIEELKKKYPDIYISHTGHSLGALIAEVVACNVGQDVVSFDSPGSKHLIIQFLKSQGITTPTSIEKALKDKYEGLITSYFAEPNFINVSNEHIGTRIRVYPIKNIGVGFKPPAEHIRVFPKQLKGAAVLRLVLSTLTARRYTGAFFLSFFMLIYSGLKYMCQYRLTNPMGRETTGSLLIKLFFPWISIYYAESAANKLLTFFSHKESCNDQLDYQLVKSLFEIIKKFIFISILSAFSVKRNFYENMALTALFMVFNHLHWIQPIILANPHIKFIFDFIKRKMPQSSQTVGQVFSDTAGGALGYAISIFLLRISQDTLFTTKVLLGDSHSMERILSLIEFSCATELPLPMSRIKSWPEGMLTGHSRVISIQQLISKYNRTEPNSHVDDLDDFTYDSIWEKKQTEPSKKLQYYQNEVRVGIHYEVTPIKPDNTPNPGGTTISMAKTCALFKAPSQNRSQTDSLSQTIPRAKL